jgi:SAM-dependent methyltransferase
MMNHFDDYCVSYLNVLLEWKSRIPNDWKNLRHIGYLRDYSRYLDLVLSHASGGRVLDWGAGNGHVSYLLKKSGKIKSISSFLVNADNQTIEFLSNGLDLCVVNSLEKVRLPYKDGEFECVISSGVLEHVVEYGGALESTLSEIFRVLTPGGVFICWRLPFSFSIWEYFRYALGDWYHEDRYTPHRVQSLMSNAGFSLTEISLDGLGFVAMRAALRRSMFGHKAVEAAEFFLNAHSSCHLLLNDICFVATKS